MEFICTVKSIKADVAKKEISITFSADMTDENMETASDLAFYVDKEHGDVEVKVLPRMQNFLKVSKVELTHPVKT